MKNKKQILSSVILFHFVTVGCSAVNTSDLTSATATTPSQTDAQLVNVISNNSLAKLSEPGVESNDLVLLGESLFSDTALSGARDISCLTCHQLTKGLGDALPFSIGTGGPGVGTPTARNAPALYNLGRTNQIRAFLDGRVSFSNQVVTSSVAEISGTTATRSDVKNVFTNVYDIQPLFPLLSVTEMLGSNNDLAAHTTDIEIWQSVLSDRLLNQTKYVSLFNKAFPTLTTAQLNPGHIGRAIGAFMKVRFKSNNTAFDRYVSGEISALTEPQKRGMLLFYTRAQCVRCHSGSNFTDLNFHSSGAPQIGFLPFTDDLGRAADVNTAANLYKFKTPSLRNISLTAPYMHDGAFETLEAVVNHYSNVQNSLASYQIPSTYQSHYQLTLNYDNNTTRNQNRISQIDNGPIRNGLNLSVQEKSDLVDFLRNGLRDPNF